MKKLQASAPQISVANVAPGLLGRLGDRIITVGQGILQFVGDLTATVARGLVPGNWRRTMRSEFMRALYRVGFNAIPAVAVSALLVGIGFVLQIIYWLGVIGQENSVGDFLVLILAREMAPVVTALILIGRSGTVILDEVAHLSLDGQIRVLESHGVDPTDLIAVPRTFAIAVAVFVLNMLFLHLALWSGYLGATLTGHTAISLLEFVETVLQGMTLKDHLLLLIKPLIIGLVIAFIPIWLGLRTTTSALAVRQAMPRQFVYSLLATFLIGTLISAVL